MDIEKEIIESIDRLKPELFDQLKDLLIPSYLTFYTYKSQNEIDKHAFEEKLFGYFAAVQNFNKKKSFPLSLFVDELFPLINVRYDKKLERTTILKYVNKASDLKKKIASGSCSFDDLRDFTRIVLSIYPSFSAYGKDYQDEDFSFDLDIKKMKYAKSTYFYPLRKEKRAKDIFSGLSFAIALLMIIYFDICNSLEEVE